MRFAKWLCFLLLPFMAALDAGEEKFVDVGELRFWCETFGKSEDPALLLVMGSGGQGIMWPTEFCERLTQEGFFVIRYDNRDTGLSSSIDYAKNPYSLMDLGSDAIGILDSLNIQKAHVVGASMGGSIATLLGAHFPDRLETMVLMLATSDLSTVLDPTDNNPTLLPKPKPEFLDWMREKLEILAKTESREERINLYVDNARICNGSKANFDEESVRQLTSQIMDRTQNLQGLNNHFLAMGASLKQLKAALPLITVPTLVLNGTEDPIFSVEHGQDLAKSIPGAKLILLENMGHNCNPVFYDDVIRAIKEHAQK